jgi:hypothetical protein
MEINLLMTNETALRRKVLELCDTMVFKVSTGEPCAEVWATISRLVQEWGAVYQKQTGYNQVQTQREYCEEILPKILSAINTCRTLFDFGATVTAFSGISAFPMPSGKKEPLSD